LATKGSSVAKVAGKKRFPAKPWENAGVGSATAAIKQIENKTADLKAERFLGTI
jgi:hypothetical protein